MGFVGIGVGGAFLAGAAATFFLWPKPASQRASIYPVVAGTNASLGGTF